MTDLTEEQIKEYREVFEIYDRKKKGSISTKEMCTVMRQLGENLTEAELYSAIEEVDADGNGQIEFWEFLQMMRKRACDLNKESELREVFKLFDRDEDGFISPNEFRNVMCNLGEKCDEEAVNEIMREIDTNKDGKISFEEFAAGMKLKD